MKSPRALAVSVALSLLLVLSAVGEALDLLSDQMTERGVQVTVDP